MADKSKDVVQTGCGCFGYVLIAIVVILVLGGIVAVCQGLGAN